MNLRKYCVSLNESAWFESMFFFFNFPPKYTFTLWGFRENSDLVTVFPYKLRI
jgi:hypothetical protein